MTVIIFFVSVYLGSFSGCRDLATNNNRNTFFKWKIKRLFSEDKEEAEMCEKTYFMTKCVCEYFGKWLCQLVAG